MNVEKFLTKLYELLGEQHGVKVSIKSITKKE